MADHMKARPKPRTDVMHILTITCGNSSSLNKPYRHLRNSLIGNTNSALLSELVVCDVNGSLIVAYRIMLLM